MRVHPESQNVNFIGNRVFADVTGLDEFLRSMVALITSMTGILIRRENRHTDTSKTTCEDTGRDSGNVVTAERPQD